MSWLPCPQPYPPIQAPTAPHYQVCLALCTCSLALTTSIHAWLCHVKELTLAGALVKSAFATGSQPPNGKAAVLNEDTAAQERLKEAGNQAFKVGNFQEAIEKYSLAIKAKPSASNSVIFSNRAQALIKVRLLLDTLGLLKSLSKSVPPSQRSVSAHRLGQFKEAERDCTKALQAGPNAKALLRRGTARAAVSNLDGAMQDFKHVLALEPSNRCSACSQACNMKVTGVSKRRNALPERCLLSNTGWMQASQAGAAELEAAVSQRSGRFRPGTHACGNCARHIPLRHVVLSLLPCVSHSHMARGGCWPAH